MEMISLADELTVLSYVLSVDNKKRPSKRWVMLGRVKAMTSSDPHDGCLCFELTDLFETCIADYNMFVEEAAVAKEKGLYLWFSLAIVKAAIKFEFIADVELDDLNISETDEHIMLKLKPTNIVGWQ